MTLGYLQGASGRVHIEMSSREGLKDTARGMLMGRGRSAPLQHGVAAVHEHRKRHVAPGTPQSQAQHTASFEPIPGRRARTPKP